MAEQRRRNLALCGLLPNRQASAHGLQMSPPSTAHDLSRTGTSAVPPGTSSGAGRPAPARRAQVRVRPAGRRASQGGRQGAGQQPVFRKGNGQDRPQDCWAPGQSGPALRAAVGRGRRRMGHSPPATTPGRNVSGPGWGVSGGTGRRSGSDLPKKAAGYDQNAAGAGRCSFHCSMRQLGRRPP